MDDNEHLENILPLHQAVYSVEEIKTLLEQNSHDVDAVDAFGHTVLHLAVQGGLVSVVKMLVEKKANLNVKNNEGYTSLHYSVITNNLPLEIVEELLNNGSDLMELKNTLGQTALHLAARQNGSAVKLLLERGANVNAKDNQSERPVHIAARNNKEALKILVGRGAEVNVKDIYGQTPLHLVDFTDEAMVKFLLLKGAKVNTKDKNGEQPLHLAVTYPNESVVKLLLNGGAEVNVRDKDNQTPLHAAARFSEAIVKLLLNNGAEVNAKNKSDKTPLLVAISYHNEPVVKILLEKGAKVNMRCKNGGRPLHFAVHNQNKSILKVLMDMGAEVNVMDNSNNTPLHVAVRYTESVVKALVDGGAEVNLKNNKSETPLHIATNFNKETIVQVLLESGAKVDAKNKEGNTALHIAVEKGNRDLVEVLLAKGAKTNSKNKFGQTALHVAVKNCSLSSISELLDWGHLRDMIIRDKNGNTPFDLALRFDFIKIPSLFIVKGQAMKLKYSTLHRYFDEMTVFDLESMEDYGALKMSCLEELEGMKVNKIGHHSLFDVFSKSNDPTYLSNEQLELLVKSSDLRSEFPIYASLLRVTFERAKQRSILMDEAQVSLTIPLPREIIRKILAYVSEEDLLNIIDVKQISQKPHSRHGVCSNMVNWACVQWTKLNPQSELLYLKQQLRRSSK